MLNKNCQQYRNGMREMIEVGICVVGDVHIEKCKNCEEWLNDIMGKYNDLIVFSVKKLK